MLNGLLGLAGWKWMYLVEAIPTIILGIVVLICVTDRPPRRAGSATRNALGSPRRLITNAARSRRIARSLLQSFWDAKVLLLALN